METTEKIYALLEQVPDPEVPVLSVVDLGVIRDVEFSGENKIIVTITPTYTGCPAMDMIAVNIKAILQENGYKATVKSVLSPAWTTDWLSEEGKRKLKEYGIAPPAAKTTDKLSLVAESKLVTCPRCDSNNTKVVSQFGSTPCKSLYQCLDCLEPFDYFKCH
jgi:ring-1,2-phenylacetyl-CoA epoxidase subunit PaaD